MPGSEQAWSWRVGGYGRLSFADVHISFDGGDETLGEEENRGAEKHGSFATA